MAIDFPSTAGQPTDGTFTHSAAGITWEWDGTSWKARGSSDAYTLPIASTTALGGVKVGNNLAITSGGVLSATASATDLDSLTDVTLTSPTSGQVLSYNGTAWVNAAASGGGGSTTLGGLTDTTIANAASDHVLRYDGTAWVNGVVENVNLNAVTSPAAAHRITLTANGIASQKLINDAALLYYPQTQLLTGPTNVLQNRATASDTANSVADGAPVDMTIACAGTYALLKVETDIPAWVTIYVDAASRTADSGRVETADPAPGSGVIAEVITSATGLSQLITPGTIGFNNDSPVSSTVYVKAVNKSGATNDLTVTLTYVKLEA